MEFDELLSIVGNSTLFRSSLLLAGNVDPAVIRVQLSRWVAAGKILQIRRGLYAIAPPYQKVKPHPFVVANQLHRASYVSMQSALSYYGLIPEVLYSTTSVTTGRPERLETPLGVYEFRHIKTELLFGYQLVNLDEQQFLIALPEKGLLDLLYLQPGADSISYLAELRLQNLELLDERRLMQQAQVFGSAKIDKAVQLIFTKLPLEMEGLERL